MPVTEEFVTRRTREVPLRDGTRVVLRPVVPEDKALLAEGFERLSPQSRYRRFFTPMTRLTPSMLAALTELDYADQFAWVALTAEDAEPELIGAGRYARLPGRAAADVAIAVVDAYHGRGLGGLLLDALVFEALEAGITCFEGFVLADNTAMLAALRRVQARLERAEPGTLRFRIDLPARAGELRGHPLAELLRSLARGEAELYGREPCPWAENS